MSWFDLAIVRATNSQILINVLRSRELRGSVKQWVSAAMLLILNS